jgi:Flp pilus assembly protein TadG
MSKKLNIGTRARRNERGQAMVEFALVAPVLLLILLGIIQFAITFNHYLTLTDAVRAGARQASVGRSTSDPVGTAVARVRSAASGSLDTSPAVMGVEVTYFDPVSGKSEPIQGGNVTVKATYPFSINILGIVVKDGTLTSETTERVE